MHRFFTKSVVCASIDPLTCHDGVTAQSEIVYLLKRSHRVNTIKKCKIYGAPLRMVSALGGAAWRIAKNPKL